MAIKVSMHNWMRPEPIERTIERLARFGYDGIEISGEPDQYDVAHVRGLLEQLHGAARQVVTDRRDGVSREAEPDAQICPQPGIGPEA